MDVPVTGSACLLPENCVTALGRVGHLFGVACLAIHSGNLRRMREIFDSGVAGGASKSAMEARGMLFCADGNAFPSFGTHVRLAVTGEAGLVRLERLSRFFLPARQCGIRKECQAQKEAQEYLCRRKLPRRASWILCMHRHTGLHESRLHGGKGFPLLISAPDRSGPWGSFLPRLANCDRRSSRS